MARKKTTPPAVSHAVRQGDVANLIMNSLDLLRGEILTAIASSDISLSDNDKATMSHITQATLTSVRGKALGRVVKLYEN